MVVTGAGPSIVSKLALVWGVVSIAGSGPGCGLKPSDELATPAAAAQGDSATPAAAAQGDSATPAAAAQGVTSTPAAAAAGDTVDPTKDGGASAAGPELTPNDVSVLFPSLPADELWPATLPGRGGPILPANELASFELSLVRELPDEDVYAALRVVSLRFDPCFQHERGGACQPQMRLVFQVPDPAGGFFDGAFHALYAIDPARLGEVATALRELARIAPENAAATTLAVSPVLRARGLQSPYADGLRKLVASCAGGDTLVRVTFMTRTASRSGQWQFGGFEKGKGKLRIAGLAEHASTQQNVTRSVGHDFEYAVIAAFAEPAGRIGTSGSRLRDLDAAARADVHAWALRQEDPAIHLPDTTDCASCHLSGHIARHLEDLDPSLVTPSLAADRAARELSGVERDSDNLRAFGWFGKEPMVAQRTANETAVVLRGFAALP